MPEIIPEREQVPQSEPHEPAPYQSTERAPEYIQEKLPRRKNSIRSRFKRQPQQTSVASGDTVTASAAVDPEVREIENILAENMGNFFLSLSQEKQLEFKSAGEETAQKIQRALHTKATRIKDIVSLIINWLKTLPGINKFFLEQEAKIKADKIMKRYTT